MKLGISLLIVFSSCLLSVASYGQSTELVPGKTIEKKILKGETHRYTISLQKGDHAEFKVKQVSALLTIVPKDSLDGKAKILVTRSPENSAQLASVSIESLKSGKCELSLYPTKPLAEWPDSLKSAWVEENQGDYSITDFSKLSAGEYKKKLDKIQEDKDSFAQWIKSNALEIKTVDAGNGFADLQPFKSILKDVRVVGLGEATHGTSEFFRMKHRMLEFLVKEMGFTSIYFEAPMTRCRYINNYVLKGIGDLDTAAAIHGFSCWRVEDVKNMIGWMRQYNASVTEEKKVKFFGFDLQMNDMGWKGLKDFYGKVNPQKLIELDSLGIQTLRAVRSAVLSWPRLSDEQKTLLKTLQGQCQLIKEDIVFNQGLYEYLSDKKFYDENLMNIKLIIQELETRLDLNRGVRDKYMADNILYLLNQERPGAKVALWAHNGHLANEPVSGIIKMGNYLANILKTQYYNIGFEFYSGTHLTRNWDTNKDMIGSKDWDIVPIGIPPIESLPWYLAKAEKDIFFIDFRNTGTNGIKNFSLPYKMHYLGARYTKGQPDLRTVSLSCFNGLIYIKESTAAKNCTRVYIESY